MRKLSLALAALGIAASSLMAQEVKYKKIVLTNEFWAEGAYYGDFNKDGKMDIVAGPWWLEGPDFTKKHEYRPVPAKAFDPKGYSDNFLTYVGDFNGDGWPDILCVPFPGKEGYWYENPQGKDGPWKKHLAVKNCGGESPVWVDVDGDGKPELVYNISGEYGYAKYDPAKPDDPWRFIGISGKGSYGQFNHGQGAGDINGDGRCDILESGCWWEQPKDARPGEAWIKHPYKFAAAAAQLLVYDVDGDGLNDVITASMCHGYGLVWHKQIKNEKGEITFKENVILPPNPDVKSDELRFSQPHALDLVDMNGDGLMDILTGKRWWAHGPTKDEEPMAPAVVYWFELKRDKDKGVQFIPHKVDDDSGVGTQVTAKDLNGDGLPDVIVGNKKGIFIHMSQKP